MAIRCVRTGLRTATTTTDSYTFAQQQTPIQILKIEIVCSASTDFKLYTTENDGSTAAEYILGASGSVVTVNTTKRVYPGRMFSGADGADLTKTEIHYVVDRPMIVAVSNIAAADTWYMNIYYTVLD